MWWERSRSSGRKRRATRRPAQLIRDESSNLYFATRTGLLNGRQLTVTKFNAAGVQQWTYNQKEIGPPDLQFSVRALSLSSTHLVVGYQTRDGGGSGNFLGGAWFTLDRTAGTLGNAYGSGATGVEALASGSAFTTAGGLGIVPGTDVAFLGCFVPVTGQQFVTVYPGNATRFGAVAMDASNNIYSVHDNDGVCHVTKYSDQRTLIFNTTLQNAEYSDLVSRAMVVDATAQRIYVLVEAKYAVAPFDQDVLLFCLNATTGAVLSTNVAVGSVGDDFAGSLLVRTNVGVLASGYDASTTTALRYSKEGVLVWNRAIADTTGAGSRSLASDVDGNVMVLTPATGAGPKISRIQFNSSAILQSVSIPAAANAEPHQIFTDSAGAAYVNFSDTNGAHLARVQHADMNFLSPIIIGGNGATLRIQASGPVDADQIWTLTSNNPSVAQVGSSATITLGNSQADVPVTTNPVSANTNVSINARNNGLVLQKTLTVLAPQLTSIGATPNSLIGGNNFSMSLSLTGNAPTGGRTITLNSSKPAVISLPATYTIPAGVANVAVGTATQAVNTNQGVVLYATLGAVTKTVFMAVNAPSLTNLTVSPGTVQGGANSTLNLTINGIAPTGGFSITLISGAPGIVFLPGTASVAAGLTTRSLNFATSAVTSTINVTLFATRAGIYRTTTLSVTP